MVLIVYGVSSTRQASVLEHGARASFTSFRNSAASRQMRHSTNRIDAEIAILNHWAIYADFRTSA
jgi:hypothetical protein